MSHWHQGCGVLDGRWSLDPSWSRIQPRQLCVSHGQVFSLLHVPPNDQVSLVCLPSPSQKPQWVSAPWTGPVLTWPVELLSPGVAAR